MRRKNDLGKDPIGKLVLRIALPSMLAQFVSVLYSIVDRMYIGHIPGVGELALAGVGVCGPVVTMIGSVASLVGVGGAPLMSIKHGRGRRRAGARAILANCFVMLCVFARGADGRGDSAARADAAVLWRERQPRCPMRRRIFLLLCAGTVFALLATGMNSVHHLRRASRADGDGFRAAGRGDEHRAGPGVHLRAGHGRDGRGHRHGDLPGRPAALTRCAFCWANSAPIRIDRSAAGFRA